MWPSEFIKNKETEIDTARAEFNFQTIDKYIGPSSRVLDVGAWKCLLGKLLNDRKGCGVLNLDIVNKNETSLPFRIYEDSHLPVDDDSFDVVLFLYVLHHSADDLGLLKEASRVCTRDGLILVAEDMVDTAWNRTLTIGFHYWLKLVTGMGWDGAFKTVDQWRERFAQAGLVIEDIVHLGSLQGKHLWPKNVLFALRKADGASSSSTLAND